MEKTQRTLRKEDSTKGGILYMAFELSQSTWKLAFSTGRKIRTVTIEGRDLDQLQKAIDGSKSRFTIVGEVRMCSCCEADRDGFWLHRYPQTFYHLRHLQ